MRVRNIYVVAIFVSLTLATVVGCDGDADESSEIAAEEEEIAGEAEEEQVAVEDEDGDEELETDEESESPEDAASEQDSESESDDEEEASKSEDAESEEEKEEGGEQEEVAAAEQRPVEDFEDLAFYATGPVASVDGEKLDAHEFNIIAEQQLEAVPDEALAGQAETMKEMLVQGLVVSHLVEREIEEQGIEIDEADVDEAVRAQERMLLQQFGGDRQQMTAALEQQGLTEEMLREQVERELAAERLVTDSSEVSVSEQKLRQAYQQHQARMQQPEQTRARHILLHVDDEGEDDEVRELAEKLAGQLEGEDADFEALAREHSDCPTASKGGDLGYFTREQLMPEFTEAAFAMSPGEVSEPVRSNLGWHVIRVEDRLDESSASFDDVRDELEMMLQAEQMQEAAAGFIEQLKADSEIEIHEDNIVVNDT